MRVKPSRRERTSQVHESWGQKTGFDARAEGAPDPGIERGESRGGYWEGEASESWNPRDGIGMKQGREDVSGKKRQEVEKTWRRNVVGRGNPDISSCSRL